MATRREFQLLPTPLFAKRWSGVHLAPVLLQRLTRVGLACSVTDVEPGRRWLLLAPNPGPNRLELELAYGNQDRNAHNDRHIELVRQTRDSTEGGLDGFFDFFVPVLRGNRVEACVVSGPFLKRPLSAEEIVRQWERLSGRTADAYEPALLEYARVVLDAVLLEGKLYDSVRQLLHVLAEALGDSKRARARTIAFDTRHARVFDRAPREMWELAAGLADPKLGQTYRHGIFAARYRAFDIPRAFTHVLAAAYLERKPDETPVERLVENRSLQRAAYDVACSLDGTLSAKLGEAGAFFLTSTSSKRPREELETRAKQIRERLERKLGRRVSIGISTATHEGEALPRCLDEATEALERALVGVRSVVWHRERTSAEAHRRSPHYGSARELVRLVLSGEPSSVEVATRTVVRAVAWSAQGSPEASRAYFEMLLVELLDAIEKQSILEARSVNALESQVLTRLRSATTVQALGTAFVDCTLELTSSVRRPTPASRRARLDAARRFIDRNFGLKLTLESVAQEAGFSTHYFSTLFKQRFGVGFERYLIERRLERARELLLTTTLPVARVVREIGFSSEIFFFAAFKRKFRSTPLEYRRKRSPEQPRMRETPD
jgi:AraC-like DNA-binding protein